MRSRGLIDRTQILNTICIMYVCIKQTINRMPTFVFSRIVLQYAGCGGVVDFNSIWIRIIKVKAAKLQRILFGEM